MGFVAAILGIILSIHLSFVVLVWGPKLWRIDAIFVLFIYHILFANLLATFYQCIMTDPGVVPPNWGFYMGDETKRRRYCKMCNVWKPDRTHHCSICNRCILNMDHHCPWINNCVGFYNRKFFMQLLAYVYMSLFVVVSSSIPEIWARIQTVVNNLDSRHIWVIFTSLVVGCANGMAILLLCTLTNFIRFHVRLVLENYTTIENLEREEGA